MGKYFDFEKNIESIDIKIAELIGLNTLDSINKILILN